MYSKIISQLRKLINGEIDDIREDDSFRALLLAHGCNYLANKLTPNKQQFIDALSIFEVRERIKHVSPLLNLLQNVPYAMIKGPVLSKRIYGSPFLRRSGDLDLLLRRQDLDEAKRILLQCGFVQGRVVDEQIVPFTRQELVYQNLQSHQTAPFVKATGNPLCPFVNLDLNTSVFWGEYHSADDADFVLRYTEEDTLLDIPVKRLKPEMEFLALCLHHYKDMNSIFLLAVKGLRLGLFCDLFYYLKNVAVDPDMLLILSEQLQATPYVYYCLWYTDQLFDATLLKPFVQKFVCAGGKALLDKYGLCDEERCIWNIDFSERLFSPSFRKKFYGSLNEKERSKIQTNLRYM